MLNIIIARTDSGYELTTLKDSGETVPVPVTKTLLPHVRALEDAANATKDSKDMQLDAARAETQRLEHARIAAQAVADAASAAQAFAVAEALEAKQKMEAEKNAKIMAENAKAAAEATIAQKVEEIAEARTALDAAQEQLNELKTQVPSWDFKPHEIGYMVRDTDGMIYVCMAKDSSQEAAAIPIGMNPNWRKVGNNTLLDSILPWQESRSYQVEERCSYHDKFWESKRSANAGNTPKEDMWWGEISL